MEGSKEFFFKDHDLKSVGPCLQILWPKDYREM